MVLFFKMQNFNDLIIGFRTPYDGCFLLVDFVIQKCCHPLNVGLWFYEQDKPVDDISCVFFSVRHATGKIMKREVTFN